MFKSDWILASLGNPTYDIDDLKSIGELSTNNTLFLSKNEYIKSSFIRENEAFKDQFGHFSEDKFNEFYDLQASRWRDFQNDDFPTGIEVDMFDTASNKSKTKDTGFSITTNYNPDRVLIGVEDWRTTSKRTKTESEIAQSLKIFDTETGKFSNETPEDYALFSNPLKWAENLFKDPVALAQYDKDEIDSEGNKHKKGEKKLNALGTYYYETLNGRSPIGRLLLAASDILTKEGSALNKVDFFDSDDLKKSAVGIIAKNLALIAPMFTPAAPYYYSAIVAKELVKTLPMLHSIATNLFGSADNETPKWINTLAAKGEALSTSNSAWSKEHTFSFENMANLISDVALQWGQLKQIVKSLTYFGEKKALKKAEQLAFKLYQSKVGKYGDMGAPNDKLWKESTLGLLALKKYYEPAAKILEKKLKLGGDLALAYMSLISNTDVYSDMLERGATKQEAAWVALGSTSAMFSVNKFLHLGEVFYDDITPAAIKLGRIAVKEEMKEAFSKIFLKGTKETPAKWFLEGSKFGTKAAKTFMDNLKTHSLGGIGKAAGEGLEEVSEEFVTDLTKATYSLLGDLGLYDPSVKNTGAFENMLERYSMSLVGGAIGGGLFYGVEKYKGFNKTRDRDLVDLINDGLADEMRKLVEGYVSEKKAGSSTISGKNYTEDSQGNITWLSTDNKEESLNRQVANKVLEKINSIEAIIVGSGTKLNKDLLFDNMVLQEARYLEYKNASHITGYYEEFDKRQLLVLETRSQYNLAALTVDGTLKGAIEGDTQLSPELEALKNINLQQLQIVVDNALKGITDFLSGDSSLDYTRKLSFALDPVLNHFFLGLDQAEWLQNKVLPKTILEQIQLNKEWNEHVKDVMLKDLDKAFLAYKALEHTIAPILLTYKDHNYQDTHNNLEELYTEENLGLGTFLKTNPFYNMNSRLLDDTGVEESDLEFDTRNNIQTPDEINKYNKRALRVADLNTLVLQKFVLQYDDILAPLNYEVNAAAGRAIILNMRYRLKDMINRELEYPFIQNGTLFNTAPYKSIFKDLKDDLSNIDQIKEQLKNHFTANITKSIAKLKGDLNAKIPLFNVMENTDELLKSGRIAKIINTLETTPEYAAIFPRVLQLKEELDILSTLDGVDAQELLLKEELWALLPAEVKTSAKPISITTFMSLLGKLGLDKLADPIIADNFLTHNVTSNDSNLRVENQLTIQEVIEQLHDPNSQLFKYALMRHAGAATELATQLNEASIDFGKDTLYGVLTESLKAIDNQTPTISTQLATLNLYTDTFIQRVLTNPIYNFYNKLKTTTKSPLENILSSITSKITTNKGELFDINYILNQVYKDYVTADKINGLILNDTQAKLLDNANKALELLSAYLYSASVTPNSESYFGQNKHINDFAKANSSKLTKPWEDLPEVDMEYATLLLLEADRMSSEVHLWKIMSDNNSMNKLARLTNTESIVNKLKYDTLKGSSFKFTVNDKEYDLFKTSVPEFDQTDPSNLLNQVFNVELTVHNNFNKILAETGLTSELFFELTNFWENYLGNVSDVQETSKFNEELKNLTKYDLALYMLAVLSDNPSEYYESVRNSIKDNENIAPLTVQLNISRLSEAAHSKTYKEGFKSLAKFINPKKTIAANTVYINGVAGTGKTEVILKNIRQRFHDLLALIIGPTTSLAVKLLNSLNENKSYTLDIFKLLVLNWDVIESDLEKASTKLADKIALKEREFKIDTEYFSINYKLDDRGSGNIDILLAPNKILFNKNFNESLIFVDEAAHMNTLQIALLDAYAESVNGTVFLASDSNQSGYFKNGIGNLEDSYLYTSRTSKLQESLRSGNILKLANNNKISALLDTVEDVWRVGTFKDKEELLTKLPNLISKLNLRVYNLKDGINGDLLGGNLTETIKMIPKDASIGFIGDASSATYQLLKAAGFTNLGEPLTETLVPGKKFMQGQEFDYVIIDKMPNLPTSLKDTYATIEFLKRFYTLMSRSKIASIFLDTTLTDLVGVNTNDDIKSIGFSISELIEKFRADYLAQLDKLKLEKSIAANNTPVVTTNNTPVVENSPELNPESTLATLEKESKDLLDKIYNEIGELEVVILNMEISDLASLMIEANTVVPITGLMESFINSDGTSRTYSMWMPPKEKTSVRRNIAAFYTDDTPIIKRVDKLRLLDTISRLLSAVIFGGDITDPALTSILGFGEAWKNRKLLLEIRKATVTDNFGIGTDLKPTYIDIDGEPYIISLTVRLDGLSKNISETPYSAIFDVCLLSDFNNLRKPEVQLAIKNNINARIKAGKVSNVAKAEKDRDNLGESVKKYEQFVRKSVAENPNGFVLELTPDMYESHKTTRLVKRKTKRRLGGTLNIANVENNRVDSEGNYIEDYNNFLDTDKRKVVSSVYIVGKKSDVLKGEISESVFGKAVVFVSSNINLHADQLADMYIELKKNPGAHTPEVRIVVLNNHGLSFTELITHRILKQIGSESKKPWRMDTLGIRMFTGMWNFRAGLENFITQLNNWKTINNYDTAKVETITKVESELFNTFGKDWLKSIESLAALDLYKTYKIEVKDIKNLIKFNLEDCKDIPNFRLGLDFTNTNIGAYVRQFDVSNSSVYGKKMANLLAIEETLAIKFHSLLSTILELLTANKPSELFLRVGFDFKPMSTKLVKPDGQDFKTNEYISKSELLRNLSGLIHTNDKNIVIGETDDSGNIISKVEITAESLFSFFPKAIAAIATKSKAYLTNLNASGLISISTIDSEDALGNFDFDVSSLFLVLKRERHDNTLFNMFNLIFHGTTESIESNHAFTEDAPFKYGIFVDPDLENSDDYKQINIRGLDGKDYTFLKCGTNPIYFDVDVDIVSGGIALNLSKIMEPTKKVVNKVAEKVTVNTCSSKLIDEQEKTAFLNFILNNGLEDNDLSYADFITMLNKRSLIDFFKRGKRADNILKLININADELFTEVTFDLGKVKYKNSDGSEGELFFELGEITAVPNTSNSIEAITSQSFDSMVVDGDGTEIMNHQDFLNSLELLFANDSEIKKLTNASSVDNYLKTLVTMKETLNTKIDQLEDSDLKWQLSDYLLFVDTTCF